MDYISVTELRKLLKQGKKVVCPKCKNGNIVPLYDKERIKKIDNYDNIYWFKCTDCDWFMEIIPNIIVD